MRIEQFEIGQDRGVVSSLNNNFDVARRAQPILDETTTGDETTVGTGGTPLVDDRIDDPLNDLRAFGFEDQFNGKIRIFSGVIEHGTQVFEAAEKDVSMISGTNFIFVEYIWGVSASIPAVVATRPLTSDFSFKKPLYQFTFNPVTQDAQLVKLEWYGGNIHIPSGLGV